MLATSLFIYSLLPTLNVADDGQTNDLRLLCSEEFCDEYLEKHPCPDINEICFGAKKNASGQFFPSMTPCNCCANCLIHLKLGDDCSLGAPGAPVPHYFCGPHLKCRDSGQENRPKCLPIIDTLCMREQIDYDAAVRNGTIGQFMHRPECDENGNYRGFKCTADGLCYCVDTNGQRIFGEVLNGNDSTTTMNCECSRMSAKVNELIDADYRQYSLRCLDDGSFDPMQCMADRCMCVNRTNAVARSKVYTMGLGTGDGDVMGMHLKRLPCFNQAIHHSKAYLHDCETVELNRIADTIAFERNGFIVLNTKRTQCDPNGRYARVQYANEFKFCANKFGNQIEQFRVERNATLAQNMNCHCAFAQDKLLNAKKIDVEMTECCPNGNYPKVVCRRGYCFCADTDGNQIVREVRRSEINTLSCYNNGVWC